MADSAWAAPPVSPQASPSPASTYSMTSKEVQEKLRSAVAEWKTKLGALEEWQRKIFDEEVVPQYSRFIRDYKQTGTGAMSVEVDSEVLRRYLSFYAPKAFKRKEYRAQIYLSADADCKKCQDAMDEIKALAKARIERRGFLGSWLTPGQLGVSSELKGKPLEDRIADLVRQKDDGGALVMQWGVAPVDPEHPDEKHYLVRSYLLVRKDATEVRQQGELEVLPNDSLSTAAARLLTDAMSELGVKSQVFADAAQEHETPEVLVTVSGFKDFAQFNRVKSRLQESLKDVAPLEERRLMRGQVTLAVRTERPLALVKSALDAAAGQQGEDRVFVTHPDEQTVKVEIR